MNLPEGTPGSRTHYTIEITAREKEACQRWLVDDDTILPGDCSLIEGVLRKIAASVVKSPVPETHNTKHLLEKLLHAVAEWKEKQEKVMAALDDLVSAINKATGSDAAALTSAVDAAVTELGTLPPTDAQLASLTTQVQGLSSVLQAQTARLVAATTTTNPPPPPPAPTP